MPNCVRQALGKRQEKAPVSMRPARPYSNRRRHMLHQAPLPARSSALSALARKKKETQKKRRKTRAVDRQRSLGRRGEHDTPCHRAPSPIVSLCSADEVSRPLLACIIKPVITPVRRAACITVFCTSKVLDVNFPLPASLQKCRMQHCFCQCRPTWTCGEHGSAITLCLVTSPATAYLLSVVP